MKKTVLGAILLLLMPLGLVAQGVTQVPFSMSFEQNDPAEVAELNNWVLNPGANAGACTDKWYVGNQLHNDGSYGLYISNQGAQKTGYGDVPCVQFVYRDFQLPNGTYYISFDYIAPNENGKLYMGVLNHVGQTVQCNNMVAINNPISGIASMPNVGNYQELPLSTTWANGSYQLMGYSNPTNGQVKEARLFFAWVSNATDSAQTVAAAIDNVQITHGNCVRPENLTVEVVNCDSINLTWDGSSVRYQAQYRKMGSSNWRSRTVRDGAHSIVLENMQEGNYDFRVRGICYETDEATGKVDTLYSPYTFLSNVNIFCPDKHCINFVAITDTTVARCTYGTTGSGGYYETADAAFSIAGVVDYGWESINSRHTVNWDTLATDPRTGNQLHIVRPGENASVRLGNWDTNYGTEAITYDFYVDPDNSILLLNYAIVLEDPDGHGDDAMPRFVLQVFDENGVPLDSVCGRVDLNPLNEDASWNHYNDPESYSSVVWKDWTTMGLNLDPYVGQRLKISVATYDCFWSAHYGYAYFSMGCAAGHLKNKSCGAQQTINVEAPEGFDYLWTNTVNTNTFNTREITLTLNDPVDWVCTLTSLENPDCSFQLFLNTEPRYPVADFAFKYEPKNCENRYVFENRSFIRTSKDGKPFDDYTEDCDDYTWDFGFDGEESDQKNPGVIVFPEEGGTFTVSLTAMIGDGSGSCRDEKVVTLEIPAMGEFRGRHSVSVCEGDYVDFYGDRKFETGQYVFNNPDPKTGCLAIDTLDLTVIPKDEPVVTKTEVCFGDSVRMADGQMALLLTSKDTAYHFVNHLGCDSVVVFSVYVSPQILPSFAVQEVDEDHETASIEVSGFGFTDFIFEGKKYSGNTVLNELEGGDYNFRFFNADSCILDTIVEVGQGCLRNIVYQRWNDVLSLKREDLAPSLRGLLYQTFQWRKDGIDIPNAVESYYYAPDGLEKAEYTCYLILSDGSENITCSFYPILSGPQKENVRKELNNGKIRIIRGDVRYDIFGNRVE